MSILMEERSIFDYPSSQIKKTPLMRADRLHNPFRELNRFNVMLSLYRNRRIAFTNLQQLLGLTPGNLDHHIRKLLALEYVSTYKIISWRPLTVVEITAKGENAFIDYINKLKTLLRAIE